MLHETMDGKLFYLPPAGGFANMNELMRTPRVTLWIRRASLAACALLFLGGAQVLPASSHRDLTATLHNAGYIHDFSVCDPLTEESTEGREHEVRAQSYLVSSVAPAVNPETIFSDCVTVISLSLTSLTGCNTGSRAPPHLH